MKKKVKTPRSQAGKKSRPGRCKQPKKADKVSRSTCTCSQTSRPRRRRKYDFVLPTKPTKIMPNVKFNSYIRKVLKKVKPRANIDKASVRIMDTLVKDTLHQIASRASEKMGRRKVLKPKIIVRALKKVIPKQLLMKVDEHAQKALNRYMKKCPRRR